MVFSWRFKLTSVFSLLLLILIGSFALLCSTKVTTHAANKSLKMPLKQNETLSCGAWRVITSPNVAGYSSILYGVTAISANNVWAVGYYQNSAGTIGLTLIEHWNGTKWKIVPSPNPTGPVYSILTSVVALSANNIWAAGYTFNVPSVGSSYDLTLIEHWNGSKWRIVSSPNAGSYINQLSAVTATSTNDVWAVGYYQNSISSGDSSPHSLIEHWNGSKWKIVPSVNVGSLESILTGITASSPTNAWAVGFIQSSGSTIGQALVEHWNGTNWSIASNPSPGTNGNMFNGVTAVAPNQIRATGYYQDVNSTVTQPLNEYWDGFQWHIDADAIPPGSTTAILNGITAISVNSVWAVGYFDSANNTNDQTLIEQWNGSAWNVASSPNVGKANNRLAAVTHVPGTSQTWAVGFYNGDTVGYQTLIEFHC